MDERIFVSMRMRTKKWARPELAASPYYIKEPVKYRGRWQDAFKKKQPIHMELGCGKGISLAAIAKANPDVNFIGIDSSVDILGVARRNIAAVFGEGSVDNVLLVSYNIERIGEILSGEDTIDRIYIYFCNPWPKAKHNKRRLTHSRQLNQYKQFLKEKGEIYFKTDDDNLFEESQEYFHDCNFKIVYKTYDLHCSGFEGNWMSEHEIMFANQGIKTKFLIAKKLHYDLDCETGAGRPVGWYSRR